MFSKLKMILFSISLCGSIAISASTIDPGYFDIVDVQVTEIATDFREEVKAVHDPFLSTTGGLTKTIMIVDQMIALGEKIWTIIEKGRPVVHTEMVPSFSVMPKLPDGDDAAFYDMSGWTYPTARTFQIKYTNTYHMTVVSFDYTIHFQHHGQYLDKGRYLTGVSVSASNVNVAWGYNFSATSSLVNISNVGTRENPVAGATINVEHRVKTVVRDNIVNTSFYLDGNGKLMKLN